MSSFNNIIERKNIKSNIIPILKRFILCFVLQVFFKKYIVKKITVTEII